VSSASRKDESVAAHGAQWITIAFAIVGLSNYAYALLLTRLLNVSAYAEFAAGQGLILWTSTIAIVCVPWVLAQALARSQSEAERRSAIQFAKIVSSGSGLIASVVAAAIATRFASPITVIVLAVSIFIVFLGTATTGWLQGRERMRELSVLYVAENLLKNGAGVLLVVVAKQGVTGALAAFGIGGLVMLPWWPRTPRKRGRTRSTAIDRYLWLRAMKIGGAQSLVSLFVAVDVVMVALLPDARALTASYQVSAVLSRVPLFIASAVATAFFPSLSKRAESSTLAARAVRMYAAAALPLAAILVTVPSYALGLVFPAQYSAVGTLLKYTAVTGLSVGGISLITAFFQAADDYTCLRWLSVGLGVYIAALLAGWKLAGISGLAAGGTLGSAVALGIIGYRLVRQRGFAVFTRVPLIETIVITGLLMLLRNYFLLWLALAIVMGLRAGVRFLRPGARHAAGPRWMANAFRKNLNQPVFSPQSRPTARPYTYDNTPSARRLSGQYLTKIPEAADTYPARSGRHEIVETTQRRKAAS
jgi:O-antigen/teichoic acid export membrane protein